MAINFSGETFLDSITEIVGYKTGVALSAHDLTSFFGKNGYDDYTTIDADQWIRIRSEEFEEIIEKLLFSLGRVESVGNKFPSITMWHNVKHDPELAKMYRSVMDIWAEWMDEHGKGQMDAGSKLLDPSAVMQKIHQKHGEAGLEMIMEFFRRLNASIVASPWNNVRQFEWGNEIELKNLFESEGLEAIHGKFFDQRYIDFLHRNFDQVDEMNWRKFEHLTAEYLSKSGLEVSLGPGRNDDGVDIRAWLPEKNGPGAHIIVQCKRQRAAVGKVVIKALYADIVHEQATSGLLVTTSRISPGAANTKTARGYKIEVADRETLRRWLLSMRQPGVGLVT
jgi:restriction system protein